MTETQRQEGDGMASVTITEADMPEVTPEAPSQEALLEAYNKMQALEQQTQAQGDVSVETEGETPEEQQQEEQEQEQSIIDKYSQIYQEKGGEFSDEDYEALANSGIPREIVDQYIQGQEAQHNLAVEQALGTVGGQDGFDKISQWAGTNVSEDQLASINEKLADSKTVGEGVAELKSLYEARFGTSPKNQILSGKGSPTPQVAPFKDMTDLANAMKDPRYNTDSVYTNSIKQRIAVSNI